MYALIVLSSLVLITSYNLRSSYVNRLPSTVLIAFGDPLRPELTREHALENIHTGTHSSVEES